MPGHTARAATLDRVLHRVGRVESMVTRLHARHLAERAEAVVPPAKAGLLAPVEAAARAVADVVEDAAEAVVGWLEGDRDDARRLVVGANAAVVPALRAAVPAATGRREYHAQLDAWPAEWPQVPGTVSCVSIRPTPARLLAGDLDDQLRALIAGAPPGSMLNCYHEAGNLAEYRRPPFAGLVTARVITEVHQHMAALCAGSNVGYGPILCMPPRDMPAWMPAGCQVYGLDLYDWPSGEFHRGGDPAARLDPSRVTARLDEWKTTVAAMTGDPAPVLAVCETNSPWPGNRPLWFATVGDWLRANGGARMLTFWNPAGPDSGPWLPGDLATIAALAKLAGR